MRDLPWRRTRDPWAVLVSEVMLQQTQVARVIPIWDAFIHRFSTVASCAAAAQADVVRAWAGLGYNRRAVNLHRDAVLMGDAVPRDLDPAAAFDWPHRSPTEAHHPCDCAVNRRARSMPAGAQIKNSVLFR